MLPKFVIQPSRGWGQLNLGELWAHRELVYFLIWRDIKVRYKQTVLGASWAVLQPLLTMVVFRLFFGRLAKVPSDGLPYPLFSFVALVPWMFFANGLTLVVQQPRAERQPDHEGLFPAAGRFRSPPSSGALSTSRSAFVVHARADCLVRHRADRQRRRFCRSSCCWRWSPALGVGLWLAALNVQFRDVRYTMPFLTQFWMFATPIAYPSSLLSEPWRTLYGLNPMVGVVEGFRWALLGVDTAPGPMVAASVGRRDRSVGIRCVLLPPHGTHVRGRGLKTV